MIIVSESSATTITDPLSPATLERVAAIFRRPRGRRLENQSRPECREYEVTVELRAQIQAETECWVRSGLSGHAGVDNR